MCLYLKKGARIRTAKEPITMYKHLAPGYKAPYYKFQYVKGELTPHVDLCIQEYGSMNSRRLRLVEAGYHGYIDVPVEVPGYNIYRFEIPKGAKYVLGKFDEIVASQCILRARKYERRQ